MNEVPRTLLEKLAAVGRDRLPGRRQGFGFGIDAVLLAVVNERLIEIGPAGIREVSDELGSSYETAYKKLRTLEDDGRVSSRKVGNARLWSVDGEARKSSQ